MLVPAIANPIKARARAPEIDDRQEKRGERIHVEMRADPRQPQRQGDVCHRRAKEKMMKGKEKSRQARVRERQNRGQQWRRGRGR